MIRRLILRVKAFLNALSPGLGHRLRSAVRRPRPRVGAASYVDPSVHFIGSDAIVIGENTVVSQDAYFNVNHRTPGVAAIEIGHDTFIGRRNFFSSGASIEIGSYVLTTIDCKFIGSTHVIDNPDLPVLSTGTTSDWRIRVGTNTFIGAGATLLGDVDVGHGCVIGALALVTGRIPPFSLVVGNPGRIVKRYSRARHAWVPADDFGPEEEAAVPSESSYLEFLKKSFGRVAMPHAAAGRRMGHI